ncbi:hypothetical protein [Paracoccus ravus]|uniref:hypothetical protein n=1 Tax=Paracoccus ravus TaxID=2447760 RepID=UPI00106E784D|nr:hypothetical protein [Paracoccus ravus]
MTDQPHYAIEDRAAIAAAFSRFLHLPEREFVQCTLRSHYNQSQFRDLRLAARRDPHSEQASTDMMLAKLGDDLESMLRDLEKDFGGITCRSVEAFAQMLVKNCRVNIYDN